MTYTLAARIAAVIVIAQPSVSRAQSPPGAKPEFEVASVRPIKPPAGKSNPCNVTSKPINLAIRTSGNTLTLRNETLAGLIMDAYNVRDEQFTGLPAWADCRNLYEIAAQAPGEGTAAPDQLRPMLQTLLADRFQLKLRRETKNFAVYELSIAKTGVKVMLFRDRTPEHRDQWAVVPMLLEGFLDYPVVDKTGLTGFITGGSPTLDYAKLSEEAQQARPASAPPGVLVRSLAPSIFHEAEAQFGLTLKKVSQPGDFLVIEHVERLSDN